MGAGVARQCSRNRCGWSRSLIVAAEAEKVERTRRNTWSRAPIRSEVCALKGRFPSAPSGDALEPSTEPGGRSRAEELLNATGGLEMKKALLLVAIGTVLTSGPRPATADPTRGPFQIMGPDGTVVRISSEGAEAWWMDYHESKCVTCRGPRQAAELLYAVENGLEGRFHGGPRYLILVESLRSSWPRAWIFYPSSDETPPYVMHPGGVGSGGAPLRWDAWHRATSRMERIILEATGATSSPTIGGAVEEIGGDGSAPVAWIVTTVVLTALLTGLGVARKRSAASPKGDVGSQRRTSPMEIAARAPSDPNYKKSLQFLGKGHAPGA
jgi:hypothetical protein